MDFTTSGLWHGYMTVGGLAYDWMLTDVDADAKVDSPWTKMKMKTTVPGWNSCCRVREKPVPRFAVVVACSQNPVLPMAAPLAQTG